MAFLEDVKEFFYSGDPVVREWFLIKNDLLPFILCFTYAILSKIGPYFMRNRKPFDLRNVMIIFNFSIVLVYVYVLTTAALYLPRVSWKMFCWGGDLIKGEPPYTLIYAAWFAYAIKYIEFLDTLFFILRKKEHLITFLHVFHHTCVPILAWVVFRTEKNGLQAIPGLINTVVHVVMYSYYGLAAMGPNVRKYLWWKKHLTQFQIAQFIFILFHVFFIPSLTGCPMMKISYFLNITFGPAFLFLFYRFYKMSFGHTPKKVE